MYLHPSPSSAHTGFGHTKGGGVGGKVTMPSHENCGHGARTHAASVGVQTDPLGQAPAASQETGTHFSAMLSNASPSSQGHAISGQLGQPLSLVPPSATGKQPSGM